MAAASNAKFKENLTCPVCLEIYNEDERLPKCMPCQHSCCLQCILKMVRKNSKTLKCPLCQAKFAVPAGGVKDLPTNVTMVSMLELLPDNNNNDDTKKKKGSKPLCHQHGYKECIFMCTQCKVGLCNTCITTMKHGPHYGHMDAVDELDVAMKDVENEAKAKSVALDEITDEYVTAAKRVKDDVNAWKTSMKQEVSKRVKMVITSVSKWQAEMNKEIDDISKKVLEGMEDLDDKMMAIATKLTEIPESCANYDVKVHETMRDVSKQMDELKKVTDGSLKNKVPTNQLSAMIPASYGSLNQDTATLVLVINDVKAFRNRREAAYLYSQHWYVHGLPWRIKAIIRTSPQHHVKELGVFLECDPSFDDRTDWSVEVEKEIQIICHDVNKQSVCKKSNNTYDSKVNPACWGYNNVIAWDRLVDPAEGFVKNNSVTIEVTFTAKQPKYQQ